MIPLTRVRLALLAVATILVAFACAYSTNPVTGRKEFFAYSWQDEIKLGFDADQGIVQEYGIYDDEDVRQYVDRIGRKVLENSHLRREGAGRQFQETVFSFRVLDSRVVNAFALPGGYIYVTRGLLAHVENEAQLGVVLGHEIGHVAARHSSQRAFKSQLGQIGLIGGAMLGQAIFDISADEILQLGSTAMQYLFLSYSRDDEREADRLGVEYASMTGYSADEASRFFRSLKRIQQKSGASIPPWQSTHPDPGEREETIIELASGWRTQGYNMTLVNRDPLYDILDGVVVGDNPRQGFVANNVFYHPEMRFQFPTPADWYVLNQPAQVQIVEPSQQAAALILLLANANSAEAAAQAFLGQQGVTVVSQGAVDAGPFAAYSVVADITQESGVLRIRRTYINMGNGAIIDFMGIASQNEFATYDPVFQRSHFGFNRLTNQTIIDIKPARLDIVAAPRRAPFQSFLPTSLPMQIEPIDLAIMNQVDLETVIPTSYRMKLVTQ